MSKYRTTDALTIITAHVRNPNGQHDGWWECRCGQPHTPEHILAALTADGYAVIRLPEPTPGWCDCYEEDGDPPDHNAFSDGECGEFTVTTWHAHPGEVQVSHQDEPLEPFSIAEARALAAALLSAADDAEAAK
jgi:hypothetical protein